jgi:superoxide dismutase, Cu-Zn family
MVFMVKSVPVVAALVAAPVAVLSACTTQPSNPPPSPTTATSAAPGLQTLTTQLKTADGTPVANATFEFADGYATLTVGTISPHILTPGFHGMHIHAIGKCEANSVAPAGGPPGDFLSAGGHYQAPNHTGHPHSGALTSLEVRSDGSAKLVTTSDAFTAADLVAGNGTALIIHQGSDDFGNIPPRYHQPDGAPGPDEETMATGDAGKRVACGVIGAPTGSTVATATTTATTTSAPATGPGGTTVTTGTPTVTGPGTPPAAPTTAPGSPAPPGGG